MSGSTTLRAVAVTLDEANAFVSRFHRHAPAVVQARFQVGVADEENRLRGVAIVGNGVAPSFQRRGLFEIRRVCTDGYRNACSFLYARSTLAARELGFQRGYTYTHKDESGASLRALRQMGWRENAELPGRDWAKQSGRDGRSSVSPALIRWRIDLADELPPLLLPEALKADAPPSLFDQTEAAA